MPSQDRSEVRAHTTSGLQADEHQGGSIVMVVATDAPLSERNLGRLARRAIMGLSRTGSYAANGSGDYVIAFSTAAGARRNRGAGVGTVADLHNNNMSPFFEATVESTEEAIYNSMLKAVTVTSNGHTVETLPIEADVKILRRCGAISDCAPTQAS